MTDFVVDIVLFTLCCGILICVAVVLGMCLVWAAVQAALEMVEKRQKGT
jgi:hypothetical protein